METLVAISILMVAIAGPMVLVGNGIRASAFARDQVTAFYLAQDAVEALRYIRDDNRIEIVEFTGDPDNLPEWDSLIGLPCLDTPCRIDTEMIYEGDPNGIVTTDAQTKHLFIDGSGKYNYDTSGTETVFKRWFTITNVSGSEVQIVVTVDWSSGAYTRSFSIRENLFYWN